MKNLIKFTKDDTTITFHKTGDLNYIISHQKMINQISGNHLDGSINQIYLRVHTENGIKATPMIGSISESEFGYSEDQLSWRGQFENIQYQVNFKLAEKNRWFWQVTVKGNGIIDIIYGQDIGNAEKAVVETNEAYISQYIDHHVTKDKGRYVISSRQNQPQDGKFPLVEQGSLNELAGFSTDGYQFFGTEYKTTNTPKILTEEHLANEVYQYEFAYIALQSQKVALGEDHQENTHEFVFYGLALASQDKAVTENVVSIEDIKDSYKKTHFDQIKAIKQPSKKIGKPVVGLTLTEEELEILFPKKAKVEKVNDEIYSFFANEHHVVLKAKENAMERAHGHILLSGQTLSVDDPIMSSTVYMYGIFNSQIVLGNTTSNKLSSNSRNSLNVMKSSGQRFYILEDGNWRLLTMPSAFEMGLNSATWYYKLADDMIKVSVYTVSGIPNSVREIRTELTSATDKKYTFAITNQLIMGPDEGHQTYNLNKNDQVLTIKPSEKSVIKDFYPDLTYYMAIDQPFELTTEKLFMPDCQDDSLTVFKVTEQSSFTIITQGTTGDSFTPVNTALSQEDKKYSAFIDSLLHHFKLSHDSEDVTSINLLIRWYTHNMLVHYLSPHGLEQYGGAAWGTRDVSQGPTEFFLAIDRPEIVASIISHVYENQFDEDGNWPQWFMFDKYEKIKASESHGDVIIWPLKVVTDYLEKSQDFEILKEEIPYTSRNTYLRLSQKVTLLDHIKKQINYIETNFLQGTYLSCYGDGDWDDTLQPNNSAMKKQMASSWTVALTYQVLKKFATLMSEVDKNYADHLNDLVAGIKADYQKYMLGTDTLPGFVYMKQPGEVELMIHPTDKKTGIQYRLLPMTRSMIAELLDKKGVEHHFDVIKQYLQFPDGVRLMNRPAHYNGGVSTNFKRAEQAANFGREIGLQYVHAHIRFAEAMAKIGESQEAWRALTLINPIAIKERVPNAEIRQANTYFSSSDGDFKTRYEAQDNFDQLRDGEVTVKGGWRIYSSGPGIYINQLLSNILGIRENHDKLVLDPVLPIELDGLELQYELYNKKTTFKFHVKHSNKKVYLNEMELPFVLEENRYREGGIVLSAENLKEILRENNHLDIYI